MANDREELILQHYPLVRSVAARMVRRLPSCVELDELTSIGLVGLIDAVERFDPSRGVPFRAFAEIRIRGAIVDALRQDDIVPRTVRRRHARLEDARAALRQRLYRDPTAAELAGELGMSLEELYDQVDSSEIRRLVSLESPVDHASATRLGDQLADEMTTVEDRWLEDETTEEVQAAVLRLPPKERKVIEDFYLAGKQLRAIGAELDVSESRVCQIRAQAVGRMQSWLTKGKIPRTRRDGSKDESS